MVCGDHQVFEFSMRTRYISRVFTVLILILSFSSCESISDTLYSWGSYESQVHAYLKGDSREAQISVLEKELEKIESNSENIPPGFLAHLGLLYSETGNDEKAIICFQMEKEYFPEAIAFMDFLLDGYRK